MPKNPSRNPAGQGAKGERSEADLERRGALDDDQVLADADQTAADADQTAADADQAAADEDQRLSDADQAQSERDQRASDSEQAAADREFAAHHDPDLEEAHDAARAEREAGKEARKETTLRRVLHALGRSQRATQRDKLARRRDLTAEARDQAAESRDRNAAKLEQTMPWGSSFQTALEHAGGVRTQAAADRARAAADREQAARDRARAAEDRAELVAELRRAHLDDLTGAYRRGLGESALQDEIDRSRRGDGRLVLGFVDIDGLKQVNNRQGHAAGDELLRDVVATIRSRMRSYEPIVRYGGDEFICAISGIDLEGAVRRFDEIKAALTERPGAASIRVGLSALRPDDSLADLIARADRAMLAARSPG